jgi:hypothetical protein
MQRPTVTVLSGLACLGMMAPVSSAKAMMIAPQPIPLRVAGADVVVVGKVTGFGDRLVSVDGAQYQIAKVKVDEALIGAKGAREVQVGFLPASGGRPGGPIRPGFRPGVSLSIGQEAGLILTRHPTRDFYLIGPYFNVINKKAGTMENPNWAKEVGEVKKAVKLLANPSPGLKSRNKEERFLTAALLITRYRTPRAGTNKTVPVDAEQSKRILLALADADWATRPGRPGGPGMARMNPQAVFFQLGLTDKDGWTPPKDFRKFADEARKWLRDHAGKYRIQRFVPAKGEKSDTPSEAPAK